MNSNLRSLAAVVSCFSALAFATETIRAASVDGWLNWRGPKQNGTSAEKGLPDKVEVSQPLWVADFPGQSTAVVANGKVYVMGYQGDDADLQEGVGSFDAETGKLIWHQGYNDF